MTRVRVTCGQSDGSFSPTETARRLGERGMRARARPSKTPHLGVALAIALVCLAWVGVAHAQVGAEPVSEAPAEPVTADPPAAVTDPVSEPPAAPAEPPADVTDPVSEPRERAPRGARGTARRRDRPRERAPRERAPRGARGTAGRGDGPRERAPGGARGVGTWRLDRRDQLHFDHTGHRCSFLRPLVGLICGSRARRRAVSPPLGFRPGQACLAFGSRSAAASDCASSASACERGGLRRFRRRFLGWSLRRPCRVSHSGSPWVGTGSEPVPYSGAGTHARRRPRTA